MSKLRGVIVYLFQPCVVRKIPVSEPPFAWEPLKRMIMVPCKGA